MICASIILWGCEENQDDPIGSITKFELIGEADVYDRCCTYRYTFKISDNGNDEETYYYWLELVNPSTNETDAYSSRFDLEPPFTDQIMNLDFTYNNDSIMWGAKYNIKVYKVEIPALYKESHGAQRSGPLDITLPTYDHDYCKNICCTRSLDSTGGSLNNYVGLFSRPEINLTGNLTGLSADIETRWGETCKECKDGMTAVFIGLHEHTELFFGSIGYGIEKKEDETTGDCYYESSAYAEVYKVNIYDPAYWEQWDVIIYDSISSSNTPNEGDIWNYKILLDHSNGLWSFYINNIHMPGDIPTTSQFGGYRCDNYFFESEIWNYEDDMVGSVQDSCSISNCAYQELGGQFQPIQFNSWDTFLPTNNNEWGIYRPENDSLVIWDKDTLD